MRDIGKYMVIFVLSLIFLALIATPVANAEDINTDSGNVTITAEQYWGYHISLPDGGGIKYTIEAEKAVNAYLLDEENFQKYVSGQSFQYIDAGSSLGNSYVSIQLTVDPGDYYLIVESSNYETVNFTYDITYGKDVEISWLEFFSGFGGSICLISGIFFILWLFVLIWVYRDAKRRGKSGVLWFFIVLILGIIGLIIWLIVRPKEKQNQQRYVPPPPPQ